MLFWNIDNSQMSLYRHQTAITECLYFLINPFTPIYVNCQYLVYFNEILQQK